MTTYRLIIGYDPDTEQPGLGAPLLEPVSFNREHHNFRHPDTIDPEDVAFGLSYYEHGLCQWTVVGEPRNACQWDSVANAGVLLIADPTEWASMSAEQQRNFAIGFTAEYTEWCNGACYWYSLETEDGEFVDSCGGFIGDFDDNGMMDYLTESLKPGDVLLIGGEAGHALNAYPPKALEPYELRELKRRVVWK